MFTRNSFGLLLVLFTFLAGTTVAQNTISTTKIVDNGPDGGKLVFAILGDGYAAGDQPKYQQDVNNLIVNGLIAHDFYRDNRTAFNVYRVDLVSRDSGVSKPDAPRDTAWGIVYTGDWNRCWIGGSSNTDKLINDSLIGITKPPDFVLVMANEDGYGGCHPGGNRLYVTSGSGWEVVAHEYGHAIGDLFDEYWNPGAPMHDGSKVINALNCSTELDKARVAWRLFVDTSLSIPPMTDLGPGIDANTTVGMFPGCDYESSGIYRPSYTCRMREVQSQFCPVCRALMERVVAPLLGTPAPPPPGNAAPPLPVYLNLLMKVTEGGGSELLKVAEVSGADVGTNQLSSGFVFEVSRGSQTIGAGALREDPFVMRGFADPNNNRGEMRARAKSVTIVVRAPGLELSDATINNVGLRFYKIRSDAPASTVTGQFDAATLTKLKQQKLVDKKFEISASKLKSAAREIGVRSIQ